MYLVTTALREFWPDSGAVWLLSPGCLPFPEEVPPNSPWDIKGTVPDPWKTATAIDNAYNEVEDFYNKVLPILTEKLNEYHGTTNTYRYWNRMLGIWLRYYITAVYVWFHRLSIISKTQDSIRTIGLSESSFVIPASTHDSLSLLSDDLYNLQVITRLSEICGVRVERRVSLSSVPTPDNVAFQEAQKNRGGVFQRTARAAYRKIRRWSEQAIAPRAEVIMCGSYFAGTVQLQLAVQSGFKVVEIHPEAFINSGKRLPLETNSREKLYNFEENRSPFLSALWKLVPQDIPTVFVEDYKLLCRDSERQYAGLKPSTIFSSTRFWDDESFKHWASLEQERGTTIIYGQHGLNYGMVKHHAGRELEQQLCDVYTTWGWNVGQRKNLPMPAQAINGRQKHSIDRGAGILFCGTSESRFYVGGVNNWSKGYLQWQATFFTELDINLHKDCLVRLYQTDYGWRFRKRLGNRFTLLTFDSHSRPFRKSLERCRLFVSDNISTTVAEALSANVPTVLFWNPQENPLMPEAEALVNVLGDCNVYHSTPQNAAAWINKIYGDIESWWADKTVQDAVNQFCSCQAKMSKNFREEWLSLLLSKKTLSAPR